MWGRTRLEIIIITAEYTTALVLERAKHILIIVTNARTSIRCKVLKDYASSINGEVIPLCDLKKLAMPRVCS